MTEEAKLITGAELSQHTAENDVWLAIEGKVYAVPAEFLDDHPGGPEVILAEAGKDATGAFDDIGHSDTARDLLETMLIGTLDTSSGSVERSKSVSDHRVTQTPLLMFIPLAMFLANVGYRYYLEHQ